MGVDQTPFSGLSILWVFAGVHWIVGTYAPAVLELPPAPLVHASFVAIGGLARLFQCQTCDRHQDATQSHLLAILAGL